MRSNAQALIIGGGIAGGAAAALLARAGRDVILVERKGGPHDKVCGEFISSEATLYLRELNIDLESLGAVRISTVRLYARDEVATARLPFPAFSVSRRALDEAVLGVAAASGAAIRRGRSVRSLHACAQSWTAQLEDGHEVSARDAFLATGKHDLRGWKRPPGRQDDLIAFKLHCRLDAAQTAQLASCVELFVFPGGYAGLELVENDVANLCLVVRRREFAQLDHRWDALVGKLRSDSPPLDRRLCGSDACWERPLAVASIPYGHVHNRGNGPWRLGDQAAVIPSFAGDGISIALHSARLAADYYLAGKTGAQFQSQLARDVCRQVRWATFLSLLLVRSPGQRVATALARVAPALIGQVARRTRIPGRALLAPA
jgi:flavin-dependent dehydrogenase